MIVVVIFVKDFLFVCVVDYVFFMEVREFVFCVGVMVSCIVQLIFVDCLFIGVVKCCYVEIVDVLQCICLVMYVFCG